MRVALRWLAPVLALSSLCGCGVWGSSSPSPGPGNGGHDGSTPPLEHVGEASVLACEPVAHVDEPCYLEGDEVSLGFSCSSGEPRESFGAEVVTTALGVSFDPASWTVHWTPGYSDGGRRDFVICVWPRDPDLPAADQPPETAVATVWVADALGHPDNQPVVPEEYTEEWGLPVVHLEPHGEISQEHVHATITFLGLTYEAEMKIRGAVSVSYPKNSYTLRFPNHDLDTGTVGWGDKDHLVLTTTFDDNSYVRQKLAYDLWLAMAEYWQRDRLTPRTFFAVVYLSGAYHGLYMASDRIDDHFAEEMGLSREGNLYKAINHDANFYRTDASGGTKSTLHQGYTKEEGEPVDGEEGAYDDLDALVAHVADTDAQTFVAGADDWIRVDEFMDWFLFAHYTAADDSAGKNAYLYNDPDDPEFRYAPWDFNHSFGQGWTTYRIGADTYNDFTWNNGIFAHFQDVASSSDELWERMEQMMEFGPLRHAWFTEQLDAYYELIELSAERDWSMWGSDYLDYWYGYNDNDYEAERAYLYDWLQQRDGYMWGYHPGV